MRSIRVAVALIAAYLVLAGCSHIAKSPVAVSCKGKGVITENLAAMGYSQTAVLSAECGDGFTFTSGPTAPTAPAK